MRGSNYGCTVKQKIDAASNVNVSRASKLKFQIWRISRPSFILSRAAQVAAREAEGAVTSLSLSLSLSLSACSPRLTSDVKARQVTLIDGKDN